MALVAIYDSCNGKYWFQNTTWRTPKPVSQWAGVTVSGNRVVGLVITRALATGVIPHQIGDLSELKDLELNYNLITDISDSIQRLTKLTKLELSLNYYLSRINPAIFNITSLQSLAFSGCRLTYMAPGIGKLQNLDTVAIGDNKFNLPDEFFTLTKLTYLYASGMNLNDISPGFANLKNLIHLEISNNLLNDGVSYNLRDLTNLQKLYIDGNNFIKMPIAFENLNKLIELDVQNNRLNFTPLEYIYNKYNATTPIFAYAAQKPLKLRYDGTNLYVDAGGTHKRQRFVWYVRRCELNSEAYCSWYGGGATDSFLTVPPSNTQKFVLTVTDSIIKNMFNQMVVLNSDSSSASLLPLTLKSFIVGLQKNSVQAQWQTANEVGVQNFLLQKMVQGNWMTIEKIEALNTSGDNYYSALDKTPSNGKNYYRLCMIDKDGDVNYSAIRELDNSNDKQIIIYPNPAKNFTMIDMGQAVPDARIEIYTFDGRLISARQLKNITKYSLALDGVSAGTYIVKISGAGYNVTKKLVVMK